jgi:carbonic anhydrase
MSVADEFLVANKGYVEDFKGPLPMSPARHVAVVACMDARLDPAKILGLDEGDAHVIRNAGGFVTDDALRSLAISQRLLGTNEIVLIRHTECGMLNFIDEEFRHRIEQETGVRPAWSAETFSDLDAGVRQAVKGLRASPFLQHTEAIRGFVFDVATGGLTEVSVD